MGRMFCSAAARMGYRTVVFCGRPDEPAAQVASDVVVAAVDDIDAAHAFARRCDVVTFEFENLPGPTVAACSEITPTFPSDAVLRTAQSRHLEKSTFEDAGLPVTPHRAVYTAEDVRQFGESFGWPVVLKTNRDGYDGRGQIKLSGAEGLHALEPSWFSSKDDGHGGPPLIVEPLIRFDDERSVVVARSRSGEVRAFPTFRNQHRDHILEITSLGYPAEEADRSAEAIAEQVAEKLDVVGLVCVEFFRVGERVLINEIAPRPHNSGHVTMEACHTDQFTQHVRAVAGLPLGDPSLKVRAAAMINLLGQACHDERPPRPDVIAADPAIAFHWYGKAECRTNRKMGHLTACGDDVDQIIARLRKVRDRLEA